MIRYLKQGKDAQGNDYPMEGSVVDYWPGDRVTRLNKGGKMAMDLILNDPNAQNHFLMGRQSTYSITAHFNGWDQKEVASNTLSIILE